VEVTIRNGHGHSWEDWEGWGDAAINVGRGLLGERKYYILY